MTYPEEMNDGALEGEFIYLPLIALFGAATCLYIAVQTCGKRDNSWIDVMWGICFIIPNIVIWILRGTTNEFSHKITTRMILITVPVVVWGSRLAIYIFMRHKSEDYRYKEMREGWE